MTGCAGHLGQAEINGTVLRVVLSMKQAALTADDRLYWSLGTGRD